MLCFSWYVALAAGDVLQLKGSWFYWASFQREFLISLVTESPSCLNMHTVSLHSQPKWLLSLGNSSWWQHVQAVQGHGKTRAWTRENCQKQVAIHLDESSKEFNLQYTMRILSDAQVRTNLFNSVVEILSWATWARHVMQSFQWPEQSAGKLTNIWQWSSKYGQPFPAVLYRSFYSHHSLILIRNSVHPIHPVLSMRLRRAKWLAFGWLSHWGFHDMQVNCLKKYGLCCLLRKSSVLYIIYCESCE